MFIIDYNQILPNIHEGKLLFQDVLDILYLLPRNLEFKIKKMLKEKTKNELSSKENVIVPNCTFLQRMIPFIDKPVILDTVDSDSLFNRLSLFEEEKEQALFGLSQREKEYLSREIDRIVLNSHTSIDEKILNGFYLIEKNNFIHLINFIMEVMIPYCLEDFQKLVCFTTNKSIFNITDTWNLLLEYHDFRNEFSIYLVRNCIELFKLVNENTKITEEKIKNVFKIYKGEEDCGLIDNQNDTPKWYKNLSNHQNKEKVINDLPTKNEIKNILEKFYKKKIKISFEIPESEACSLIIDFGYPTLLVNKDMEYIISLCVENLIFYLFRIIGDDKHIYGISNNKIMRMDCSNKKYKFDEFILHEEME